MMSVDHEMGRVVMSAFLNRARDLSRGLSQYATDDSPEGEAYRHLRTARLAVQGVMRKHFGDDEPVDDFSTMDFLSGSGDRINYCNRRLVLGVRKLVVINLVGALIVGSSSLLGKPRSLDWHTLAGLSNLAAVGAVVASIGCAIANAWVWRQYRLFPVRQWGDKPEVRAQKIIDDDAITRRVDKTKSLRFALHYGFLGCTVASCVLALVPVVERIVEAVRICSP